MGGNRLSSPISRWKVSITHTYASKPVNTTARLARSRQVAQRSDYLANWNPSLNSTWNLEFRRDFCLPRSAACADETERREIFVRHARPEMQAREWDSNGPMGEWRTVTRQIATPLATERIPPSPTTHQLIAPVQCYFRRWLNAGLSLSPVLQPSLLDNFENFDVLLCPCCWYVWPRDSTKRRP